VNLHGPVRVPDSTPTGTATATLSLKAWKGTPVSSTTHVLTILPVKPRPKVEPVSPNLVASLVHPDRMASMGQLKFSADGAKLFTSGYPSGIVQVWDLASKKEIRRIESPRGYRGTSVYAVLTPDWKALYVPVEKRIVRRFERDGKRGNRIEYSGRIRVWDVASGKEKDSLLPAPDSAPITVVLSGDGRHLVSIERPSYESGTSLKDTTIVWDLPARKKWKLCDGYGYPRFSPNGKSIAIDDIDFSPMKSSIMLLEFPSGKQFAKLDCPEKDRFFSLGSFSPNGELLTVSLGGKKGAPLEVWFLDSKTLKVRGKLLGKGGPNDYWGGYGVFSPDAKRYVALDRAGNVFLWDLSKQKLERTFSIGIQSGHRLAVSPDGKTLAVGWRPKYDSEGIRQIDPDPADLPQPRVTLVDLAGNSPERVLVTPHGYDSDLAFSPDGKILAFGSSGAVHLFDLTK
jgi:WD40 repeat protein